MATTVPTTAGELLFQNYLDAMDYPYEFEKEFPGKSKRPDYTVTKNGVFLFDVKDFDPYMPLGGGAYDPYPQIREKIRAGKKKFREFKEYPCSLVLKNNRDAFVHLDSVDIMLGSMYGNSGFTFPVDTKSRRAAGPMKRAFLGGGKMIPQLITRTRQSAPLSRCVTLMSVCGNTTQWSRDIPIWTWRKLLRRQLRSFRISTSEKSSWV